MLPLSLLRTSIGHPMLVELKNGETYNGNLVSCDTWMNLHLREVICTSKVRAPRRLRRRKANPAARRSRRPASRATLQDGDRFWRMPMVYVRGNTIKYLRVPEEVRPRSVRATRFPRAASCSPTHLLRCWRRFKKRTSGERTSGLW